MPNNNLEEIRKTLELHERRLAALENLGKEKPDRLKKAVSIKEFILEKKPDGDVEKTLVVGYYLEHYVNASPFNAKDLEALFRKAKESVPKNINDKVIKNVVRGFMMEAETKKDKKKAWTLTSTGERFVESGLKEEE